MARGPGGSTEIARCRRLWSGCGSSLGPEGCPQHGCPRASWDKAASGFCREGTFQLQMGGWTPRLHPRITRASLSALTRAGLSDIPTLPAPWVSLTPGSRVRSVPRVPRACQGSAPSARGPGEGPGLAQPQALHHDGRGWRSGRREATLGLLPGLLRAGLVPAAWPVGSPFPSREAGVHGGLVTGPRMWEGRGTSPRAQAWNCSFKVLWAGLWSPPRAPPAWSP